MATAVFSPEQITALSAPLDRAKVRQREQGRSSVSYLEGWQVIAEANRIFGFDGWQRETVALRCVNQSERTIGARGTSRDQRPGWGVTYTARVRITVGESTGAPLIREGCGAGHGIDTDLGQAHQSALKEAETDAMKRVLMTFGNPFGLALYDKQQREVTGGASSGGDRSSSGQASRPRATPLRVVRPASTPATARPQRIEQQAQAGATPKTEPPSALPDTAAQPPALDPGLTPLDPATIRQLHATIRGLPAPGAGGVQQGLPQALPGAGRGPLDRRSDLPAAASRLDRDIHGVPPIGALSKSAPSSRANNRSKVSQNGAMSTQRELGWAGCTAVERDPQRVSGAWVFRGTRIPVAALFENLEDGISLPEFVELFPGVTPEQARSVLEHAARSTAAAVA